MDVKSIPTTYRGVTFRSLLEASWARLMDSRAIPWEYEKKAFQTSKGGYLPDFYLPSLKAWAEVKPGRLSEEAMIKAMDVASATGQKFYLFEGRPSTTVRVIRLNGDMQALSLYKGLEVVSTYLRR